MSLPPRIACLKARIIEKIPCDKETDLEHLKTLSLATIMNVYVNHASRFITARLRKVTCIESFWDSPLAEQWRPNVMYLINEIRMGENLTRWLSDRPKHRGYRKARANQKGQYKGKLWNKDFALNMYGLHHLHFEPKLENSPREQSNALLLAEFTKEQAVLVMVGTHDTLKSTELEEKMLQIRSKNDAFVMHGISCRPDSGYTSEQRIELAHCGLTTFAEVDGKVVFNTPIATDCTPIRFRDEADKILDLIEHYDPFLEDSDWMLEQFTLHGIPAPVSLSFDWFLDGTSLLIVERHTKIGFCIYEGRQGVTQMNDNDFEAESAIQ